MIRFAERCAEDMTGTAIRHNTTGKYHDLSGGISDNGYMSLYWYDADGSRTVKRHNGGEMLYVNSRLLSQQADTAAYSLYPNGWFGIDNFSRFSRHVYIGSERIATVTEVNSNGMQEYDNDDLYKAGIRCINNSDYDSLLAVQSSMVAAYSDSLRVPYSGSPEAVRSTRSLGITGGLGVGHRNSSEDSGDNADNSRTAANDSVFYYHRDHLGSTMSVTDQSGNIVQQVEYTPWGEVFLEKRNGSYFYSPYLFNGKELDEETGLYYYGARYYDPRLSVWYSTDPMQEKYPWVSTYTNTKNNPMRFIDPDGNDEWDINEKGFIVKHTTTTKHDAFFIINKKGKRINGGGLIFNYGTVEKATTQMNSEGNLYYVYQIRGDKSSSELFEYLAQKTSVEWNLTQTGVAGKKGLNFITTSHNHSEETGMTDFFIRQLQFGYTIRKNVHSHPENTPYPSGFNEEEPGDIQYAKKLTNLNKQSPTFQIYLPKKGKYINFGPNSIAADFNLNTIPEVIIESCKKRK